MTSDRLSKCAAGERDIVPILELKGSKPAKAAASVKIG